MTRNLGSRAHSLNGLFVKFCRCIQTLHNLLSPDQILLSECCISSSNRRRRGLQKLDWRCCLDWTPVAPTQPPSAVCRVAPTPLLQLHQSVVGIDPGGRGCSRSKCICEEDLGRMDEEKRKWGRGGRSWNQEKEDWVSSWRSPPAMTFSDSTPSRCSHLTIIRGRIGSPAIKVVLALQDFWHSKFTNLTHSRTSRNLLLLRKPSE